MNIRISEISLLIHILSQKAQNSALISQTLLNFGKIKIYFQAIRCTGLVFSSMRLTIPQPHLTTMQSKTNHLHHSRIFFKVPLQLLSPPWYTQQWCRGGLLSAGPGQQAPKGGKLLTIVRDNQKPLCKQEIISCFCFCSRLPATGSLP